MGRLGRFRFTEKQADVLAIDAVVRKLGPHGGSDGGKQVDVHRRLVADTTRREATGPPGDAGDPLAAFPSGALALAEGAGAASVIAIAEPRSVVAGEKDHGVVVDALLLEGSEDFTDRPIDFHDHIAVEPLLRLALELFRHVERHVGHRVGDVEEKRAVLLALDEIHGLLGVAGRQAGLDLTRDFRIDDFVPFDEREVRPALDSLFHRQMADSRVIGPHVVGIREAEVFVETVLEGKELAAVAQMPLSEERRGVALLLEELGNQHLVVVNAVLRSGTRGSQHADPVRIASGEQPGSRGPADGLGNIPVREVHAFFGHAVEVGCLELGGSVDPDVLPALVIGHDDDDVR